ncbi:glycoside hydrolase family 61 protein [Coniophora puteana RWD-64-598 SS2]|uniref:AA9 family lytic polysaccharide monooxygenase n=1 Tax=Coniophora puteana (strain RWD-64-598) TaxID=741705 RepID=R7SEU3_CONPW|nr:glycoside hydrolase family 61 protein [Coniophora puteana RWD-64-598 SS2]EIW74395.1 glycoside hydrolase family 61 protein [Coniophora puteana RWD-64-598 SS2]
MALKAAFVAAALAASASAHATFQDLWINGVDYSQACVRLPQNHDPVVDVTSANITCNAAPSASANKCPVVPGDKVTVEMHQLNGYRNCTTEAIDISHLGPINLYMAKVDDALTASGPDADWFKISEAGLPSDNPDYWATNVLIDNCGHYTFPVPPVVPGDYLLRAEVIALHEANVTEGAQFYMSCYQLSVSGNGTDAPDTVKIPGAYKATDPGLLINIYQQLDNYTIPGPDPYNSASPVIASTAWPTTATWNTALQPTTVFTTLPPATATPIGIV